MHQEQGKRTQPQAVPEEVQAEKQEEFFSQKGLLGWCGVTNPESARNNWMWHSALWSSWQDGDWSEIWLDDLRDLFQP